MVGIKDANSLSYMNSSQDCEDSILSNGFDSLGEKCVPQFVKFSLPVKFEVPIIEDKVPLTDETKICLPA